MVASSSRRRPRASHAAALFVVAALASRARALRPPARIARRTARRAAPSSAADDAKWMREALALAALGGDACHPNPQVGCVIVGADGAKLGAGFHPKAGARAEIFARDAGVHVGRTPPCCDALVAAGLGRVVVGILDPAPWVAGNGIERIRAAGLAVDVGVEAAACAAINATGSPGVVGLPDGVVDDPTAGGAADDATAGGAFDDATAS
ncbi:hypothetical protein JL721_3889 [Aureococcus anophagefferens]|nr:hypothetical protein JL721_3889 [Aureococcus anophagefferens]